MPWSDWIENSSVDGAPNLHPSTPVRAEGCWLRRNGFGPWIRVMSRRGIIEGYMAEINPDCWLVEELCSETPSGCSFIFKYQYWQDAAVKSLLAGIEESTGSPVIEPLEVG